MQAPGGNPIDHRLQLPIIIGGTSEHSIQRARSTVDSGLGGGVELQLSAWIGLLDDSANGWTVGRRNVGALRSSGECRLNDGFEQPSLAAECPIDRLDNNSRLGGYHRHRCTGVTALTKELVRGGLNIPTRLGRLL